MGSPFTLKKESFVRSEQTPERNVTAIGFQQYLSQKTSLKTEAVHQIKTSTRLMKDPKINPEGLSEQVVFSKEFKGKEKQLSIQQSMPKVHYLEGTMQFSSADTDETRISGKLFLQKKLDDERKTKIFELEEQKRVEDEKRKKNNELEEKKLIVAEIARKTLEEALNRKQEENEKAKLMMELEERKKALLAEKLRLESLEKEKNIIQKKREQLQQEEEKQRRIKEGSLKQNQISMTRREQQGVGFGSVRTGYVQNKKMSLLTRAASVEPPATRGNDSPGPNRRQKNVR